MGFEHQTLRIEMSNVPTAFKKKPEILQGSKCGCNNRTAQSECDKGQK